MRVSDVVSAQSAKLTVADLQNQDVTLTVTTVDFVQFDEGGKFKLGFQETDKGFILNVTNRDSMVWNFGDETDGWIGQRVTFFPTQTRFNNQMVPCIRIRPAAQPAMQVTPQQGLPNPNQTQLPVASQQNPHLQRIDQQVAQQQNTYSEAKQAGVIQTPQAQGQQYDERNPPPQKANPIDLDDEIPF